MLALFMVYILLPLCLIVSSNAWFGPGDVQPPPAGDRAELDAEHPVGRLLLEGRNGWILALAVLTAVAIAPIVEEFLFRIVLQGWLEKVENRWVRCRLGFRQMVPGTFAVVISSVVFAAVHFRVPGPKPSLDLLTHHLAVSALASLLTLGIAVALLRLSARATWEDLGLVPNKLWADLKLGLLACLAVTPLVYLVHALARALLPENFVADPIPLFLLALAFGILCYRTHRISAALVLHIAFNSIAVAIALATAGN